MKNIVSALAFSFAAGSAVAQPANYCGEIEKMMVWAQGSDTYGIWIQYETNPDSCPGGFYLPHEGSNKTFVYSLLLSSKAANERVCIQTYPENPDWKIANRCKVNYAMHQ